MLPPLGIIRLFAKVVIPVTPRVPPTVANPAIVAAPVKIAFPASDISSVKGVMSAAPSVPLKIISVSEP